MKKGRRGKPRVLIVFSIGLSLVLSTQLGLLPASQSAPTTYSEKSDLQRLKAPAASPGSKELRTRHRSYNGKKFTMTESINPLGEYEVSVLLHEERPFLPSTYRLILIGREINNVPASSKRQESKNSKLMPLAAQWTNKRVTTWFFPTSLETLKPLEFVQIDEDPWPVAMAVIEKKLNTENRWYAYLALEKLASQLSMATSQSVRFFEQINLEHLNLLDLEIRLKHLEKENPHDSFAPLGRKLLTDGWENLRQRVQKQKNQTFYLYAAGDTVITFLGAKLFTYFFGASEVTAAALPPEKITQTINRTFDRLITSFTKSIGISKRGAVKVLTSASNSSAYVRFNAALSHMTLQEKIQAAAAYLRTRSLLGRAAVNLASGIFRSAEGGAKQLKYVALAQGTQIVAETMARPNDLFDTNPLVMAKKMASDKEFLANVAYMTNETFWMAGVSTHFSGSLTKKLVLCAAIGFVDSITVSLLMKDETNLKRIGFDTFWESIVGNVQTQIDVSSIAYFDAIQDFMDRLHGTTQRPGFKRIGYAIALTDQAIGYFLYAKITNWLERKNDESKTAQGANANDTPPTEGLPIKLVPILAPT